MKKKIYISYYMIIAVLVGVLARIGYLTTDQRLITASSLQSKRTMTVATVRGTIYDRNLKPLVNNELQYVAALIPTQTMLNRIRPAMDDDDFHSLLDRIRTYTPVIASLDIPVSVDRDLMLFKVPNRYEDKQLSPHIIGYLDGAGQGVSGIEKDYNDQFENYAGNITIRYSVTGVGDVQISEPFTCEDTTGSASGGVVLTIDRRIQEIVDTTGRDNVKKGAIVVVDPKSGDILASSSLPAFQPDEISTTIEQDNGPLYNRVTGLYDCGSVFKTVTVIAALDYGISTNQCYNCPGELQVGDTQFHCHDRNGHQLLNMEQAYASSCNLYFIQLAQEIGAQQLASTAQKLGLSQTIALTDSIVADTPLMPTSNELALPAALANLSFGQGKLLVSPLHITRITAAIAGSGTIPSLRLVMGTVDNQGEISEIENRGGETVLSAQQTNILKRMMESVVAKGTGKSAQTLYYAAAGKTGTAETGQINESNEPVTQSWFTGYYPADAPQYCITVMIEDANNSEKDAAEIFCEIANQL